MGTDRAPRNEVRISLQDSMSALCTILLLLLLLQACPVHFALRHGTATFCELLDARSCHKMKAQERMMHCSKQQKAAVILDTESGYSLINSLHANLNSRRRANAQLSKLGGNFVILVASTDIVMDSQQCHPPPSPFVQTLMTGCQKACFLTCNHLLIMHFTHAAAFCT